MSIIADETEISGIYYDDVDESHYSTEAGYIIRPYYETGTLYDVLYYAVYDVDNKIIARVPAWKVTVVYK